MQAQTSASGPQQLQDPLRTAHPETSPAMGQEKSVRLSQHSETKALEGGPTHADVEMLGSISRCHRLIHVVQLALEHGDTAKEEPDPWYIPQILERLYDVATNCADDMYVHRIAALLWAQLSLMRINERKASPTILPAYCLTITQVIRAS